MNKYIKNYLDGLAASLDPCPSTKTTYDLKQFKANNILNDARRKAMKRFYSTIPDEVAQRVAFGKYNVEPEILLHKSSGGTVVLRGRRKMFIDGIVDFGQFVDKNLVDDFEICKIKGDEDIKNEHERPFQELDDNE